MRRSRGLLALGVFGRGPRLGERIARLLERGREFSPGVSRTRVAIGGAALLGCVVAAAFAPKMVAFAQSNPVFSVASVKRNTTNGQSDFTPRRSGNRVIMHNTQVTSAF